MAFPPEVSAAVENRGESQNCCDRILHHGVPGVPSQEHVKFELRGKEIRVVGRLNSRVRVAIECTEDGKVVRAEGFTKDISAKGCLAVVPHGFGVGQKVRVINLVNQHASDAYLIWRGHESPAGWELGIELHEPRADFWGLGL